MRYHKDGSQPRKDEVFVFGSNLAGIHGAGAAKQAIRYGAKYGHGIGQYGNTYAIPTKDYDIKTLPLESIKAYVDRFKRITLAHPDVKFFVTRVGCGLAGYSDREIAPMFKGCSSNCSFPQQWAPFLEDV